MSATPAEPSQVPQRFVSLDAFRGLTIAAMILVNTPGSWSHVYPPLRHAHWHGCTPTDLVFPFFLFIVGAAMRFSFRKYGDRPAAALVAKILRRTAVIFLLGWALHAYPFIRQDWDWSGFRIMGVLQRIALAYGIAAFVCAYLAPRARRGVALAILLGYWGLLTAFGGQDPYGLETNLVRRIDLALLGANHLYTGTGIPFDPEGLLSTLPAAVTVILGFEVGDLIHAATDYRRTVVRMLRLGAAGIAAGWIWGRIVPINKQLWTGSYVLYTAGWAILVLAGLVWVVEVRGWKRAVFPLVVFGANAIFLFTASGLWVKSIARFRYSLDGDTISGYAYLYRTVFQPLAGDLNGSLLFALAHVGAWWLVLYGMYRARIFIKI